MTKPKPKPLPSVNKAVKLKCKDMYFRYTSLSAIAKATGVKYETLKEWVYGNPNESPEVIQTCWFDERTSVSEDEFLEIRARNRYHAQLAAAEAIDDTVNSMELLRSRKNKKGEKIPLSPYELQALTNNILNIQKINHVNEISAPKRDELPANVPQLTSSNSEVINMEAVAFALTKDKGIMKLISKEGLNGTEPTKRQESSERQPSGGVPSSELTNESGATSVISGGGASSEGRSDRGIENAARKVEATIVDGQTGVGVESSDKQPAGRRLEKSRHDRVEPVRPEPSRVDDSGVSESGGQTELGEFSTDSGVEIKFTDPFEDEYS